MILKYGCSLTYPYIRIMKMRKFNAVFDHLIDALAFIAGFFIFAMMWIECYEIVARYFLNRPTVWGVEFCEYMLFLLAFLGTTWVLKKKGSYLSHYFG